MDVLIIFIMLVAGGLFTGGALTITWSRLSVWKEMDTQSFKTDFGHTIQVTDRLQPALLVSTILSAGIYSLSQDGIEQLFALLAVGGFAITLLASVAVLVPLQKRILKTSEPSTHMYAKWQQGHTGRTVLASLSFCALTLSVGILAAQ